MLEVTIWDVQHGSAAYIKTPDGKHIVVDLGTGSFRNSTGDFSPLLHLLRRYGVAQLDGVIITHPHTDHLDDIFNFYALNPKMLTRPRHLTDVEIKGGNQAGDLAKIERYLEIDKNFNEEIFPAGDPYSPSNNGESGNPCAVPIVSAVSV